MKAKAWAALFATMVLSMASGCQHPKAQTWKPADPTYVPFTVFDLVVSDDNRFVGLDVNEQTDNRETVAGRATYLLDLKTGSHRRLDSESLLLPISNHRYIHYHEHGPTVIAPILIDGSETVRTFEVGEYRGAWWNPKSKVAVFETGWPSDREGFNVLSLLDPESGSLVVIHTEVSELIGLCPITGNFYTQHRFENNDKGANEYDSKGMWIGTLHSPLAIYSAGCGYVLPFDAIPRHGPDDWGIYDAHTQAKLIDFPWHDDSKSDQHIFKAWNPHDDTVLMMHSSIASSGAETIDAFDVSNGKVIKSWPDSVKSPPVVWSGDGTAAVTVRDHHVVFDALRVP